MNNNKMNLPATSRTPVDDKMKKVNEHKYSNNTNTYNKYLQSENHTPVKEWNEMSVKHMKQ